MVLNDSGPGSMPASKAGLWCLRTNSSAHGSSFSSGWRDSSEHQTVPRRTALPSFQAHSTAFFLCSVLTMEVGSADGRTHAASLYQGCLQPVHLIWEQSSFLSTRKVETHESCASLIAPVLPGASPKFSGIKKWGTPISKASNNKTRQYWDTWNLALLDPNVLCRGTTMELLLLSISLLLGMHAVLSHLSLFTSTFRLLPHSPSFIWGRLLAILIFPSPFSS